MPLEAGASEPDGGRAGCEVPEPDGGGVALGVIEFYFAVVGVFDAGFDISMILSSTGTAV